jgi:alpha-galactosidase
MNVTVIGGGSSSFVPPLLRHLLRSELMRGTTLTLMSPTESRLRVMGDLAREVSGGEGRLQVRTTLDQREALIDADFVIVAIAVGGNDAWESDIEIPGRYGIFMPVADSIGPGGIMRALRNAPVLAGIARDVAEVAPLAWIFNYTNPATICAHAMQTVPEVRSLSLCSCTAMPADPGWLAAQAGVDPDEILMPATVAGLNHCAAVTELRLADGRDGLALARERATEPVVRWVLETYGVLPYCWLHWTEFFPQMQRLTEPYLGRAQGLALRYGTRIHDLQEDRERAARWAELATRWSAPDADPVTLDDLPDSDEEDGIVVVDMIESILEDRGDVHLINTVNGTAIPNLPPDAVVEVAARVSADGARPLPPGPLPEAYAAHLRGYVALQQATVGAALTGSRRAALHAFLLDPVIRSRLDLDQSQALLDDMLAANAGHLPLFEAASQEAH